jgi:hypothetical protein
MPELVRARVAAGASLGRDVADQLAGAQGSRGGTIARRGAGGRESEVTAGRSLGVRPSGQQPGSGSGQILVPRTGLELPGRLRFEAWLHIGAQLSVAATSSAWCLGDWLIYGQAAYAGRYRAAIEQTSLDYQTLRNYAWVARRIPVSRRRDDVSFGHHAEVAALPQPEQDFWLRKAGELGWPRSQLRREVRASLRQRRTGPAAITEPGRPQAPAPDQQPHDRARASLVITAAPGQVELWQETAEKQGLPVQDWAARALDQAACMSPPEEQPSQSAAR